MEGSTVKNQKKGGSKFQATIALASVGNNEKAQLLLVSCFLIWSTGVFVDAPGNSPTQSPESIVTCGSGNSDIIQRLSYAKP